MSELREFVSDLLTGEGAIVEAVEPDGLDVMAPDALRRRLEWPELARLGFSAHVQAGTIRIGLEDDWLDRLGALLGERGRCATRQLAFAGAAPPNNPERHIDSALELPNAVWRLRGLEPGWCRCLLLSFRYSATSDEKRDGLVWLGFNCTTGAVLDNALVASLRRALERANSWQPPAQEAVDAAGARWAADTIAARALPIVDSLIRTDLEPFLTAMQRRARRDRDRVHAYHDDLRRDAIARLAALERTSGSVDQPNGRNKKAKEDAAKAVEKSTSAIARERMRIDAIAREYAAKLDDLRHNYALSVVVEWVQSLAVIAPVYRHELLIKRRKGERTIAMDWHVAARRMEPPPCDWGVTDGRSRLVCDQRLHLTPADGQDPCHACGKPFCRACHASTCPHCKSPANGKLGANHSLHR